MIAEGMNSFLCAIEAEEGIAANAHQHSAFSPCGVGDHVLALPNSIKCWCDPGRRAFVLYTSQHSILQLPFVILKLGGTLIARPVAFLYGSTAALTGVVLLVGTALLLCAMCARTK